MGGFGTAWATLTITINLPPAAALLPAVTASTARHRLKLCIFVELQMLHMVSETRRIQGLGKVNRSLPRLTAM